jgi:hypothetical protein
MKVYNSHMPARKQAKPLSLKAFTEALEKHLASRSADELRGAWLLIAQSSPPSERRAFLDQLKAPTGRATSPRRKAKSEALLEDIDDTIDDIEEFQEAAGEWEDEYAWGGGYYNDEDSLGPYQRFVEPLTELFRRAQRAFGRGDLRLAREVYAKLFTEALQLEDDYGRGVRAEDLEKLDIREHWARYLRAIYETETPSRRPGMLLAATLAPRLRGKRASAGVAPSQLWIESARPMVAALIDISSKPLPDQDRFMQDWIALLRKQKGAAADAWLREAVRLAHGTAGLGELARADGHKHPRAYLDWCRALAAEGNHSEVLAAAQTALKALAPTLPIRAAIADELCAAALRLGDQKALQTGQWEGFSAAPVLTRLLVLWEGTPDADARARRKLMRRAARQIAEHLAHPARESRRLDEWYADELEFSEWVDKSVLAHAYLLAGDLASARQLAEREKVRSWGPSDKVQGFVVAFCLELLSGKTLTELPRGLNRLWRRSLDATQNGDEWPETARGASKQRKRLEHIYASGTTGWRLSPDEQETLLAWCLRVAKKRVAQIVGEQHRRSYDMAAALSAACAEVLRIRGQAEEGRKLLDDLYARYPRHRAFLSELDEATGRSSRSH